MGNSTGNEINSKQVIYSFKLRSFSKEYAQESGDIKKLMVLHFQKLCVFNHLCILINFIVFWDKL